MRIQVSYLQTRQGEALWALPVLYVDGGLTRLEGAVPVATREEACQIAWEAAKKFSALHPGSTVFEDLF